MKRLSLLFALSIVLLSFGLANAIDITATINPATQFVHPGDGLTYTMGNTATYIDINIGGTSGDGSIGGYSQTHEIYSPTGATISWGAGGADLGGAMDRLNGWEDASYWGMLNDVVGFSFDGSLPDTFNHTTASITGMEDNEPVLPRMRLYISVLTAGPVIATDIETICVDSANGSDPTYDWLFTVAAPFTATCFDFLTVPNLPPSVDAGPLAASVEHDINFALGPYTMSDPEGDPITGVVAEDENGAPIGNVTFGGGTSFTWDFNPPCSWVTDGLSHAVTFSAEDTNNGHTAANAVPNNQLTTALTVTNSAPAIAGPCPRPQYTAALGELFEHAFSSSDSNNDPLPEDSESWSIAVISGGPVVGSYSVDGSGGFTLTPDDDLDDGKVITFEVTVEDCAGATSSCTIAIECSSLFAFGIAIEYEDGNNNPAKGGVDGLGHYLGQHAYVDVMQVDGTEKMLGFDFLIAYDNSALAAMGAYPNPALFADDQSVGCEWEYFTYRFVNNCGGGCPSGLIQIIAIADQNDGVAFVNAPDCFYPGGTPVDPFTLFTLDMFVSNDYTLECSFVPISFYWTDCGDNSIAFSFNAVLVTFPHCVKQAVSLDVFSPNGTGNLEYVAPFSGFGVITDAAYGFPGYFGAPDACDPILGTSSAAQVCDDLDAKNPIRFINFFNGGVKIICSDDIDARGDINLNGVMNEIADAVTFTNYFIYGLAAFTINVEGQKAASDVNADGIPLSVADLVFLIRIVVGDVLAIPKLSPNAVEANFGFDGQLVTVDVELGAALFVLEGNVDVNLAQDAAHMQIKSDVVNGNTRVLVYSFDKGASFSGNILDTEGKMISVEAADYYGSAYKTIVLPTTFSVQNYPNPFNAATTISMALPVATDWNLSIYNVAGQKVAEFSGFSEAGINKVIWNDKTAASGIYFYKVSTDEGSMTKKMVLLK